LGGEKEGPSEFRGEKEGGEKEKNAQHSVAYRAERKKKGEKKEVESGAGNYGGPWEKRGKGKKCSSEKGKKTG